ncbi:hypothetical protein ACFL10_01215 [Patescibacteria group bacterium]
MSSFESDKGEDTSDRFNRLQAEVERRREDTPRLIVLAQRIGLKTRFSEVVDERCDPLSDPLTVVDE